MNIKISVPELKVVKIIDEYTVVLNGGSNYGIEVGDEFEIYDPGAEVIDPDTGHSLGALEYVKAAIIAKRVYPQMTTCSSDTITSAITKSIALTFAGRTSELNVDSEEISGGYDDVIRVGDKVRKVETTRKGTLNQEGS